MPRDGMPRAYLRIDPNIDQTIPDLDTFIRLMCAAARQPERGRFKDRVLLDRAIGRGKAAAAIARGDVAVQADERLYVEGWDEWQEGDFTVAERMRRMRGRRASKRHQTVAPVTPSPSPDRNNVTLAPTLSVTTDASTTKGNDSLLGDGDGDESRAKSWIDSLDQPEPSGPVLAYLASVGATIPPNGNGYHVRLVKLVDRQGVDRVLAALKRATEGGARSDRQHLFAAEGDLEPIAKPGNGKPSRGHTRPTQEVDDAFKH